MDQSDTDEDEVSVDMEWLEAPPNVEDVREYVPDDEEVALPLFDEQEERVDRKWRRQRRRAIDLPPEQDPEEKAYQKRLRAERFSRRFGWIFGVFGNVYDGVMEWFVADMVAGIWRGIYGLFMLLLVYAIYHFSSEAIRLKQEERRQPATVNVFDGSPQASGTSDDMGSE